MNTQVSVLEKICVWCVEKNGAKIIFFDSDLDAWFFHILVKGSLIELHILGNNPYFHETITNPERIFHRVCTFAPRRA